MTASERVLTYENDFAEFVGRMHSGERIAIDDEMFDYFLEVLPPVRMFSNGFGFAEGAEPIVRFAHAGTLYAAQCLGEINS